MTRRHTPEVGIGMSRSEDVMRWVDGGDGIVVLIWHTGMPFRRLWPAIGDPQVRHWGRFLCEDIANDQSQEHR